MLLTTLQPEHSENKFSSFRIFFEYPAWLVWPGLSGLLCSSKLEKASQPIQRLLSELLSGDGEIRTLDPLLARQVLSQLSYTPMDAVPSSIVSLYLLFLLDGFALAFANGLEWTRTTDLTLIRRAL